MYWNDIYISDNLILVREYFECYMIENRYEVDTYQCDRLMEVCYQEVEFDGDYEMFYNFMVENIV